MSLLREVTVSTSGPQKPLVFKRLLNSSGSFNMNVNGSSSEVVFYVQPPPGEIWRITSWSLYVQDTGTFDASFWGNGLILTNGIMPRLSLNGVTEDILDNAIINTGDLASLTHNFNHLSIGTGDEIVTAEWEFCSGQVIRLTDVDQLQLVIRDDLTGLTAQYARIKGYKE